MFEQIGSFIAGVITGAVGLVVVAVYVAYKAERKKHV